MGTKLYRIQSLKRESLWYSFDGKYNDRLEVITGLSIPMPFEEFRQKDNKKLLSSVGKMEDFANWFTKEQINKLFNNGYSLYEYEIDDNDILYLPKGEIVFDYDKVKAVKEIQEEIMKIL